MKRRSFFLLEVLIAILLVGGFASVSIFGAFRVVRQQQKLLEAIEKTLKFDRLYMKVIAECYKEDNLQKEELQIDGVKVKIIHGKDDEHYLLEVNKHHYFVTKTR